VVTLQRLARWLVRVVVVDGILLALLAWIVPGFRFDDPRSLVPAILSIALVESLLWRLIYGVASHFGPWLFPVLSFVVTGLGISFAAWINDRLGIGGVEVADLWTGVLVSAGLTVGNTALAAIFALDDDRAYDRFVTQPLRFRFRDTPRTPVPGFLFLEIDGLSVPVLRDALARGYVPTMERWLSSGSHRLAGWEPDLSAQTSASQAGILLGSNEGIPAFRWWDKPRQALLVSSQREAVRILEEQLSTGDGLLAGGGAGRWNAFSGNAMENIGVYSVFGDAERGSANTLLGYLLTPYMVTRILTLYVIDVLREWWQAWQQRRRNVLPRVPRSLKYSFIRAATTTAMQEASRAILTADLLRGLPAVYNTFYGYDEVAHHAGIDRHDALAVLTTIDSVLAKLERVAAAAPRPYHLVVLSDHGQSQGATFKQRYGVSLADLTRALIAPETAAGAAVVVWLDNAEELGHVNLALSEATVGRTRTARLLRRLLKSRPPGDVIPIDAPPHPESDTVPEVVILASGNLGLISFPRWPEQVRLEELDAHYPRLIPGLVEHPGIAFVMVRSDQHGPLVIGREGIHSLTTGKVEGTDPLTRYGSNAARHLLRTARFANVPDVLVMSALDPHTGEVRAFEELVGNHGGLGGPQREPFLLFPVQFDPGPEPIVGAGHLYAVLKRWIAQEQGSQPEA
jgi:hypothetical protein